MNLSAHRITGAAGLLAAVVAIAAGPEFLAPKATPVAGAAGELWMRVRVLQAIGIAAGLWLWTAAADRSRAWHLAAPVAVLILTGFLFRYGVVDDAYITLRYARNLARGIGLVFNEGERVEGYTSFLWTILLGAARAVSGVDLPTIARTASVAAGAGALLAMVRWLPRPRVVERPRAELRGGATAPDGVAGGRGERPQAAGIELPGRRGNHSGLDIRGGRAALLVAGALFLPLVFWSHSGMETSLHLLWFALGGGILLHLWERPGRREGARHAAAGIFFGLAALTRPEAIVHAAAATAIVLAFARPPARRAAAFAAGWIVPVAALTAWRLAYYGDWLPNTFYVKVDGSSWALVRFGFGYLGTGAVWAAPFIVLALASPHRGTRIPGGRRGRTLLLTLAAAQIAIVLYTGADHFAEMRFLVPLLPPLLALSADGALRLTRIAAGAPAARVVPAEALATGRAGAVERSAPETVRASGRLDPVRLAWLPSATLISAGILSVAIANFHGGVGYRSSLVFGAEIARRWERIGEWLAHEARPGDWLATPVAGALPYASDLPTLDMLGLTDRTIARMEVPFRGENKDHTKWDLDYTLSRRPRWIFLGHFSVSSIEDLRRRTGLPVLRELVGRLPLTDYDLISGEYEGQGFTFLRRREAAGALPSDTGR